MLGSLSEADDAVQEAWLRLSRSDADEIENLDGWLTTVVSRICLNGLRSRGTRREQPLTTHLPDPVVTTPTPPTPSRRRSSPTRSGSRCWSCSRPCPRRSGSRSSFTTSSRSPSTRSRRSSTARPRPPASSPAAAAGAFAVRRRCRTPTSHGQREVVDAFFAAAREGDFEALVAVLDPDIVLRSDGGLARPEATRTVHGAEAVASRALTYAALSPWVRPALVNGAAGVVVAPRGRPFAIMGFTVADGRIVAIDALADPDRLAELDLRDFEG